MRYRNVLRFVLLAGSCMACGTTKLPEDTHGSDRVTGFDALLDSDARVVMGMTGIDSPLGLGLHVQPVDGGGTVLVLYSSPHSGSVVDPARRTEAVVSLPRGLVSYVDRSGRVTSFTSPASLLHSVNGTFSTSPFTTALNGGALVAFCASGDTGAKTSYYYVDTASRSLTEVTGLPAEALCVLSSDMPLARVGFAAREN